MEMTIILIAITAIFTYGLLSKNVLAKLLPGLLFLASVLFAFLMEPSGHGGAQVVILVPAALTVLTSGAALILSSLILIVGVIYKSLKGKK